MNLAYNIFLAIFSFLMLIAVEVAGGFFLKLLVENVEGRKTPRNQGLIRMVSLSLPLFPLLLLLLPPPTSSSSSSSILILHPHCVSQTIVMLSTFPTMFLTRTVLLVWASIVEGARVPILVYCLLEVIPSTGSLLVYLLPLPFSFSFPPPLPKPLFSSPNILHDADEFTRSKVRQKQNWTNFAHW